MSAVESTALPAEPPTEELRVADWLGIARYLGAAVERDTVALDVVREELRASAAGPADAKALRRAASIAESEPGTAAVADILRAAAEQPTRADVTSEACQFTVGATVAATTSPAANGRKRRHHDLAVPVTDRLRDRAAAVAKRIYGQRRASTLRP